MGTDVFGFFFVLVVVVVVLWFCGFVVLSWCTVRELENSAQESDLAMGSVRKKLEQHLNRARADVKRLQEGTASDCGCCGDCGDCC